MESVKVNTLYVVCKYIIISMFTIRYTCNEHLLDTFVVTGTKKRKGLYALIEKESHQGEQKIR